MMKPPLKITLVGYGKMGRLLKLKAEERGHSIVGKVTSSTSPKDFEEALRDADVCLVFTSPSTIVATLERLMALKKTVVVGTTGWEASLPAIHMLAKKQNVGFMYAPNFSMGMWLFSQMVKNAAILMRNFEEYDVGGMESHHAEKKDAPSGTAKALVQLVLTHCPRKKKGIFDRLSAPRKPDELHFASLRSGFDPGMHQFSFDSPWDTLTLKHQAKNREGFVAGALRAAEWLVDKRGVFTFDDMCSDLTKPSQEIL